MNPRLRFAVYGAAVLIPIGAGVGVAQAATSSGSEPSPSTSASPPAAGATGHHADRAHRHGDLRRHALHGSAVIQTKGGYETVDMQRGQVSALDAKTGDITVKSRDGFTATYAVPSTARVRVDGQRSSLSSVRTGDEVVVMAEQSGTEKNARALVARDSAAPKKAPGKSAAPAPASPAPSGSNSG